MAERELLSVRGLKTYFFTRRGVVKAVDGVDLSLDEGKTLGLVGESGCGKSVTALSILRLVPRPRGKIVGGEIRYQGRNLLDFPEEEMRRIRGGEIGMVFQEPMTSLNPVFSIGDQLLEAITVHHRMSRREAKERAIELLSAVGFPDPALRLKNYPHQLSGGMRQRVMIAIALAGEPRVLIADEPTTALDVTIQAQILDLIQRLKEERGLSVIFITHNLGIVASFADEVAVMYAGRIVERAEVEAIFHSPLHPYTRGLLESVPRPFSDHLHPIPGSVPTEEVPGCPFHPRCREAMEVCRDTLPPLLTLPEGREVRCWLYG
ncbi:MAG: dipeptide ABC transporter ATP-binding protein DppD [Deltaproteobacteria bacterium]|nr:MAG: dipeptide ABC transporter ATP-binding protein DppD [Deltaproteobacteria bacterium]